MCDFIQESGQWIAEPSEKRPWGGIWDSGAGQWSCNSGVRQSHEWGEFREFRQDEEVLQEIIKRRFGEVLQVERGEVQEIIKHLRLTSLSFGFLTSHSAIILHDRRVFLTFRVGMMRRAQLQRDSPVIWSSVKLTASALSFETRSMKDLRRSPRVSSYLKCARP